MVDNLSAVTVRPTPSSPPCGGWGCVADTNAWLWAGAGRRAPATQGQAGVVGLSCLQVRCRRGASWPRHLSLTHTAQSCPGRAAPALPGERARACPCPLPLWQVLTSPPTLADDCGGGPALPVRAGAVEPRACPAARGPRYAGHGRGRHRRRLSLTHAPIPLTGLREDLADRFATRCKTPQERWNLLKSETEKQSQNKELDGMVRQGCRMLAATSRRVTPLSSPPCSSAPSCARARTRS